MATTDLDAKATAISSANRPTTAMHPVRAVLSVLASLRLTVVLLALSIFLVLAGTLAQVDNDIWFVVRRMFRWWWAWIDLQIFFPRSYDVPGGFLFPGGWLLGTALAVNLFAAHAIRFKITGRGRALLGGWILIAAGALMTYAVILSGLDDKVESEISPEFARGLWHALRAALGAGTLVYCYLLARSYQKSRQAAAQWLWWLASVVALLMVALVLWLFIEPEARLDPSGLRIMWQLIKGGAAGLVLLAGCQLVFGRRGGIVLLHGGIALLMFSELHTGLTVQEAHMTIAEGQTVDFAEDIRSAELAIFEQASDGKERVTVVPAWMLEKSMRADPDGDDGIIDDPQLPVAMRTVQYYFNSSMRLVQPGEANLATHGIGKLRKADPRPISAGASSNQTVDIPAVYVELLTKKEHKPLGTYLFSPGLAMWGLDAETLDVGGKRLSMQFRFKRLQKDYSVTLTKFHFDRYVGTNMPKNFASDVVLRDAKNSVERTAKIWMNNPLRYAGDTLYQSGYDSETERGTVLQVVSNTGWMIPYVACMLVATGMLAHFGAMMMRFARRRAEEVRRRADTDAANSAGGLLANWKSPAVWVPTLLVAIFAGWVLGRARPPRLPATTMQIHQFGKLPLAYQARVKPYDTLARNTLRIISDKQTYKDEFGNRQPAIRWLLDVLANTLAFREHRVIRIDNLEVLETLGLRRRPGFRYSLAELLEHREEYSHQIDLAQQAAGSKRTLTQRRFLELGSKISLLTMLHDSFKLPSIRTGSEEETQQHTLELVQLIQKLNTVAPRAVPPLTPDGEWRTLLEADIFHQISTERGQPVNEAMPALRAILDAYAAGDVQRFNSGVAAYAKIVQARADADRQYDEQLAEQGRSGQRKEAEKLRMGRVGFEAFFNHLNPFLLAMVLYLVAFVLSASSWLGWSVPLGRAANWLLWFTFILHSFALVARIYISGRPPVTNLYSSAVFIGWAAVLFALLYEMIARIGVGNLLAAAIGFPTLLVAYHLAGDGDTFRVLQAVLDTQFWLATHVVCITLGYSTTLLAGALGILYLLSVHLFGKFQQNERLQLTRMTYGTICFAIFFSFVGTVLGGLWADDSWGRFWGWDPKENGALIIVLWNALVLHARWGRMIGPRGLAVLAVLGNIVTTWSWFGVNELGVGLHSYGASESSTVYWLEWFVFSQLAVVAVGCLPFGKRPAMRSNRTAPL